MKDSNYGCMTFAIAVAALVISCSGYRAPAGGTFLPLHSFCSTMGRTAGHAQAARTSMLSAATLATTRLDEHARWKRGELEDDRQGRRSQGARYARDAATQAKIHCELAAMADTRLASMTEAANVRLPEQASDLGSPTSCAWTDELLAPTADATAAIEATRQAAASRDAAQRWAAKSCDEMAGYGPASDAPTIDARHVCAALTQLATAAREIRARAVASAARAAEYDAALRRGEVDPKAPPATGWRPSHAETADAERWQAATYSLDLDIAALGQLFEDPIMRPLIGAAGALHLPPNVIVDDTPANTLAEQRATTATLDALQERIVHRCGAFH